MMMAGKAEVVTAIILRVPSSIGMCRGLPSTSTGSLISVRGFPSMGLFLWLGGYLYLI